MILTPLAYNIVREFYIREELDLSKIRSIKKHMPKQEKVELTKAEKKEQDAILQWHKARVVGKLRYILVKGTLGTSILATGIFVLITSIQNNFSIDAQILLYYFKMFILFLGVGTLLGIGSWELSERKYQKYKGLYPERIEK